MISFATTTIFGVDWIFLKPYIVVGLALGGVYALSGVGVVVLYQATGVLNLAFGAIGAAGALISYYLVNHTSTPHWIAYLACVVFGAIVNVVYGMLLGPAFAGRDPLVKMMGTLGLALILLGVMAWRAPAGGAFVRVLQLPTSDHRYTVFGATVNLTQILALAFALILTVGTTAFLRFTKIGTAMRALASDREITATLGVPVRRVELAAWLGSLIGRLRSLWVTLAGGLAVGLLQAVATPYSSISAYRTAAPFVLAIIALLYLGRHRTVTLSRTAG